MHAYSSCYPCVTRTLINMRGSGCQALDRPVCRERGWVCTGRDLTMLLSSDGLPCVLPTPMVPAAQEEWADSLTPVPFAGGDHYHLVAPDSWLHA